MTKKFWLDPKIDYEVWRTINNNFPDSGPTPQEAERILWEMMRDRQINIYLEDTDDPIVITTNPIPTGATLITNPK